MDEDDDSLELPPDPGGSLGVQDPDFEPDDDEDLGLFTTSEPESVGLDTEAGLVGAPDLEEDELATLSDDESIRWSDDSEAAGEVAGEFGGDSEGLGEGPGEGGGSEYGWTDGNDPIEDGGFDDGVVTIDESDAQLDDGGAEGLGEDALELEVDPSALPPLDKITLDGVDPVEAGDSEPDDLDNFVLDVIGDDLEDEDTSEVAEGLYCARLPADRVLVETVYEAGQPLLALVASAHHGVAFFGGRVLVTAHDAGKAEPRYGRASALWDLAAADTEAGLLVALATPEGLLCSRDGGRSFSPAGSLPGGEMPPNRLAITRDGDHVRLWAAAPEGALCASDDRGASFALVLGDSRVLRLSSDGRRAVIAVARDEDGAAVAEHSVDGGALFERLELPAGEVERLQDVRTCRETVMACRRAPEPWLLIGSSEDPWMELLPHAAPPAALVDEDGGTVAYCCVQTDDAQLLLRRALDGGLTPQVVARLPRDVGAALQLSGSNVEGVTTLQLGTERSWLRVTLRPGGGGR